MRDRLFLSVVVESRGWSTACWIWTGAVDPKGYGRIRVKGQTELVHRVAYEQLAGPIPKGLTLDHLCRVPPCVNPAHLEPVTNRENLDRGIHANRSKTHCPRGHAYDLVVNGGRRCRTCLREQQRAYKQRQKRAAA